MKKYISIYFEISLIDKIKEKASEEGRSFNNMVIELIRRGMK
ncbi:hypothetical protein [Cetobacterium sp.]